MTNLLKSVEFIFVPFVNPDGYVVSLHLPCMSVTIVFLLLLLLFFVIIVVFVIIVYCSLLLLLVFVVCCDGGIVSPLVYLEQ